jgi:hypothetical protein
MNISSLGQSDTEMPSRESYQIVQRSQGSGLSDDPFAIDYIGEGGSSNPKTPRQVERLDDGIVLKTRLVNPLLIPPFDFIVEHEQNDAAPDIVRATTEPPKQELACRATERSNHQNCTTVHSWRKQDLGLGLVSCELPEGKHCAWLEGACLFGVLDLRQTLRDDTDLAHHREEQQSHEEQTDCKDDL